jgi:hypothetical protein
MKPVSMKDLPVINAETTFVREALQCSTGSPFIQRALENYLLVLNEWRKSCEMPNSLTPTNTQVAPTNQPPTRTTFLVDCLVRDPSRAEEIIGDLTERFNQRVSLYGVSRARSWYRWHAFTIVVCELALLLVEVAKRSVEAVLWMLRKAVEAMELMRQLKIGRWVVGATVVQAIRRFFF